MSPEELRFEKQFEVEMTGRELRQYELDALLPFDEDLIRREER